MVLILIAFENKKHKDLFEDFYYLQNLPGTRVQDFKVICVCLIGILNFFLLVLNVSSIQCQTTKQKQLWQWATFLY